MPEHFQRCMERLLECLKGALVRIDDTLVCGKTCEEHDRRLVAVLQRILEGEGHVEPREVQVS